MSVRFVIALALFNMTSVRIGRVLLTLYAIKLGAGRVFIGMLAAGFSVIPVCLSSNLTRLTGPVLFGLVASSAGLAAVFWLNAAMLASGSLLARSSAPGAEPKKE